MAVSFWLLPTRIKAHSFNSFCRSTRRWALPVLRYQTEHRCHHCRRRWILLVCHRAPKSPAGWAPEQRIASLGRLRSQLCHILRSELRSLAAEACGDVVGHIRDLLVGISIAERGHRDSALRRKPSGPGDHDLG